MIFIQIFKNSNYKFVPLIVLKQKNEGFVTLNGHQTMNAEYQLNNQSIKTAQMKTNVIKFFCSPN